MNTLKLRLLFCSIPIIMIILITLPREGQTMDTFYTEANSPQKSILREEVEVLAGGEAKTYMDYKKITNISSPQYQFIYNSGEVMVCEDGFIRTIDREYTGCAFGSYFGEIGSKYELTLESGKILKLIKIEQKDNDHTCSDNFKQKYDGSVIEFVVEPDFMQDRIGTNGMIHNGNFNNCEDFKGKIVKIEKILDSKTLEG